MKARRTFKTHPFLVVAWLPAGHIFGLKKKKSIRRDRFKTLLEAEREEAALLKIGALTTSIREGK
jgi:hypothetical protein